jgi:hypothetical protein
VLRRSLGQYDPIEDVNDPVGRFNINSDKGGGAITIVGQYATSFEQEPALKGANPVGAQDIA